MNPIKINLINNIHPKYNLPWEIQQPRFGGIMSDAYGDISQFIDTRLYFTYELKEPILKG